MEVTLEFGGGLEQLVRGEKKRIKVFFSEKSPRVKLFHLISFVARRLLAARPESFAAAYTPEDAGVYAQLQADRRARGEVEGAIFETFGLSGLEKEENLREVENKTSFSPLSAETPRNSAAFHSFSTPDLLAGAMQTAAGVLALVNEVDAEVLEGPLTPIADKDTVTFIATLHGG
ncbi:hypothetical protein, conserved [Eimeria necatrix]|uniref:Ubiquitin-related modifier 1 n=1 Tax=Eimeria necatrix TaxID=51315 RepID=U6N1X7_9EIME|nr:hypothetical protein, conserved [Eimeria necatrix]CDJ67945.1 hypothetical protein, conserved [Eimeria necatrix]